MEDESFSPVANLSGAGLSSSNSTHRRHRTLTRPRISEEEEEPEEEEEEEERERERPAQVWLDLLEQVDTKGVAPMYLHLHVPNRNHPQRERAKEEEEEEEGEGETVAIPCLLPWNYAVALRMLVGEHQATLTPSVELVSPSVAFPMAPLAKGFAQFLKMDGKGMPLDPPADLARLLDAQKNKNKKKRKLPDDLEAVTGERTTDSWRAIVSEGAYYRPAKRTRPEEEGFQERN